MTPPPPRYLAHDSAPGRKQHNRGWKHRENVKQFYENHMQEFYATAQSGVMGMMPFGGMPPGMGGPGGPPGGPGGPRGPPPGMPFMPPRPGARDGARTRASPPPSSPGRVTRAGSACARAFA